MTSSGSLKCKTLRQRDYTLYFDKAQHFTKKELGREFKMKSFLMRFLAFLKFVLTSSPRSLTSVGIQPHWEFKKQVVFFLCLPDTVFCCALSPNIKLKDSYTWTKIESWIHLRNFRHTEGQNTDRNCMKGGGGTVLFCLPHLMPQADIAQHQANTSQTEHPSLRTGEQGRWPDPPHLPGNCMKELQFQ